MSLHVLANHMATKGRGGDSMLVHMTPSEVHALQKMAERHGTSLTINPDTGLPEAFKLKDVIKAVAPVALGAFLGPAGVGMFSSAMGAGLAVGAGTAALTGDIGKGLSAGLGAYGGFGLGEGLMSEGASALGTEAYKQAAVEGATPEAVESAVRDRLASATAGEKLGAGFGAVTASPSSLMGFATANPKTAAAAAAPLMLSTAPKTQMPGQAEAPGYIRQYYYDPVSHSAKPLEPIATKDWGSRTFEERVPYLPSAASGGIVALAQGGAVGMADGGFTDAQVASYIQNNALSGQGLQDAADVFGISADQLGRAQSLLSSNDASVQAASQAYNAAVAGHPELVEQNLGYYNPATHTGTGWEDVSINRYIQDNPNATYAQMAEAAKGAGITNEDIQRAFNRYGYSAADLTVATQPTWANAEGTTGLAGLSANINRWVQNANASRMTPAETRARAYADLQASGMNMQDVVRATGKTIDELFPDKRVLPTTPITSAPDGTKNPYGNESTPGDQTRNVDGSVTVQPNIPGRPYGGFTGIQQLKDAYTAGGGNLGQVLKPTRTYQNTGMSAKAYDYLMGKGAYPTQETGIGKNTRYYWGVEPSTTFKDNPYWINPKTRRYEPNPNYVDPALATAKTVQPTEVINAGFGGGDGASGPGGVGDGDGDGDGGEGVGDGSTIARGGYIDRNKVKRMALGGIGALAGGGQTGYNLGGYSDGGRLLRGPGDGVSDSIPATIGGKQPARLADGEFVVPARIVSELGNGSTEAGARKLYSMMDRVQKARGKTTGKGKVAKDTGADKYLPA